MIDKLKKFSTPEERPKKDERADPKGIVPLSRDESRL